MVAQLKSARKSVRAIALGALVIGVASLPRTIRAEGRPSYSESIVGSVMEAPMEADPALARTQSEVAIARLSFDTLYECDGKEIRPRLAMSLPVPDPLNPMHVEIPLRPRMHFQGGARLGAADVAKSLQRVRKLQKDVFLRSVGEIEARAESVVLKLLRADSDLARQLCDWRASITPGGTAPTWQKHVGSGPFVLRERSLKNQRVILEANPDYHAGRPYVSAVTLRWSEDPADEARLYERGGSHFSLRGAIAFAGHKPKYETTAIEGAPKLLSYIGFGAEAKILDELRFRRAISEIAPRRGMRQIGTGEKIYPTHLPLVQTGRTPRSSVRKAKELLRSLRSSYPALGTGSLQLQILVNRSRPDDSPIAERIAVALHGVGIPAQIQKVAPEVFAQRVRDGKCQLYIDQMVLSEREEDNWLLALARGKNGDRPPDGSTLLRARFVTQTPIAPLFLRSLRVSYRAQLQRMHFRDGESLTLDRVYSARLSDQNP